MGNRQSFSTIEFVNKSDSAKIEIQIGDEPPKVLDAGITTFKISAPTPSVVRGYDKFGRQTRETRFTIGAVASSQLWKVTGSGVKHKRSPFFTENYPWEVKFSSRR